MGMLAGGIVTSALALAASGAQATMCTAMQGGTGQQCTFATDTSGGTAIYTNDANLTNVGSGLINPFLTVQKNDTESGFSTDADGNDLPLDDKRNNSNTFTNTFSLDNLGTVTIGTTSYYEFFLDVNEPDSDPSKYISLDYLNIYDTGSSSAVTLGSGTTLADLDTTYGSPTYSLGDNSLILNYDLFKGSGNGYDMELLIPVTVFASVTTSNRLVFANVFGQSGGTVSGAGTADGFEEWAYLRGTASCPPGTTGTPPNCVKVPPQDIPEPGVIALLGMGLFGLGATALRRRKS
jgi:hypothetical protein